MSQESRAKIPTIKLFGTSTLGRKRGRRYAGFIRSLADERFGDFGLSNQIQRASVSIMANIAEGFGRHSDREFANFLNMAHGSASET